MVVEIMCRWLGEISWIWKRAKPTILNDGQERGSKLAKIPFSFEKLAKDSKFFFADELDTHLLPKVGYQWMEKGVKVEMMVSGQNKKNYLTWVLDIIMGKSIEYLSTNKNSIPFLQLLSLFDINYPIIKFKQIYVVIGNYKIHKAKAVEKWLTDYPYFQLLYLLTYCLRANPIEKTFSELHNHYSSNHRYSRLFCLIQDIKAHLLLNGRNKYQLPDVYYKSADTKEIINFQRYFKSHML